MNDTKLLGKIGELIDIKLQPIKTQLGAVEDKVEHASGKISALDKRMDNVETKVGTLGEKIESLDIKLELLNKKIDQSQEKTIEVLSELITTGYTSHEKRIKRIKDHLQLPQTQ